MELGLLDALDAVGIPTAELTYYSTHGQRIWSEPRGLAAGYRWPQFSIHRGQLFGVLHRAVHARLGTVISHAEPAEISRSHAPSMLPRRGPVVFLRAWYRSKVSALLT
jgi:hypothetical protein